MPSPADTRKLLLACQRGEPNAWDRFVRQYSKLVYSVANRYRLPEADIEDIHQSVFLAAIKHLEQLRQSDRVVAWLVTTTHRECWRVGRREQRTLDLEGDFADVDEPVSSVIADQEERQLVREEFTSLSQRCQQLLTRLFEPGAGNRPDYQRLATQLNMAIGSIGPTRARCLGKLAELLRARGMERIPDAREFD
ncbi:MAG: sigma-70 family RNA polymerase sigma factor [Planctomycetota bacterium]|nr:sigma-70 family RNA polymerase sigma factor [Planctomycetota bacterium]MDA1105196.1 sigma-70 family RNA polymerase sigma factor [Planctomycetota bacterium]